jgi:glucosamine--fructose-6-phosphate aminotransferase (isomerizing)
MCGIVACAAHEDGASDLLVGLDNLEYRGYDSAGIAVQTANGIEIVKREGDLASLRAAVDRNPVSGGVGVGHTRWSTHGEPVRMNAHPHTDCTERVTVVHNGIIANHDELRDRLLARGHSFESDTDTEVFPHLVEEQLEDGVDPETSFRRAIDELEGSYAIAALVEGHDAVFAARQESPLVLGHGQGRHYLASDVPAFLRFTDRVTYLEDGDVAVITPDSVTITGPDEEVVDRPVETVDWDREEVSKGEFDHFMEKEIHAQPEALTQTIRGRIEDGTVDLGAFPDDWLDSIEKVQLLGCGTSYHAAMYGARELSRVGIDARPSPARSTSRFSSAQGRRSASRRRRHSPPRRSC